MTKYNINVKFTTKTEKTPRILDIAESFGLGLESKDFVLYDNVEIEVNKGDIVYVTGQSGSGKSVILRELECLMQKNGLNVANINDFELDNTKSVIDQIGSSVSEALELLSIAGLNDAYLFIRKPLEMSDGQKYRFKIAKLIESKADVWVADEFGAVLDRVTAKIISSNLQRSARNVGATVIVATTHDDILDALKPDLVITKMYKEKLKIDYKESRG